MAEVDFEAEKLKVKKRLMYIAGEDFYLYTYCILNTLTVLDCYSEDSMFCDHRKLPFYIYFSSNTYVSDVYSRYKNREDAINHSDRKLLVDCYYNSIGKDRVIYRLLKVLEDKDFVKLKKQDDKNIFDVYISNKTTVDDFIGNEIFNQERENIAKVSNYYRNGRKVKFETAVQNLFFKFKVGNWLV